MFQKALTAVFVLAITYAIMTPLVSKIGDSLNQSAQVITDASNGRH